jgi:cytoskeletal protein RodZ
MISLADLSAVGLRLQPAEAVAVTRDVTLRAQRGELPGIPSANVIRFSSDGTIDIEGPLAAGRSVERAARLLEAMLPGFDAPAEVRVPGALRLVLGRAVGTLDLPPYDSLDEFAEALDRFSVPDTAAAVRHVWERGTVAVCLLEGPASTPGRPDLATESASVLTISDVRRARRSTGLTLAEISERSRIPISLLRELEWGYFVNWPAGHYGRSQLIRYARAAGLDDRVVMKAVWPVLQEAVRARSASGPAPVIEGEIIDEPPFPPGSLVRIEPALPALDPRQLSRRSRLLPAFAIPALLAIGLIPAIWTWDDAEVPQATVATGPESPARERQDEPPVDKARSDVPARVPESSATEPEVAGTSAPASPPSDRLARVETIAQSDPEAPPEPAPIRTIVDASFSPAMASAGSAMFYQAPVGDHSAIMRADTDAFGAVLRVTSIVPDNARNYHVRSSGDGRMVAFDSDREGERAVYVADADGRGVRRVSGDGFAAIPNWSPDARRIAYVGAEPDQPDVWNIWVADLETGERRRVTSDDAGRPWGAAWFPGGERLAYGLDDRLIVRSLEGAMERVYRVPGGRKILKTPAVSPDGRRVVFQVEKDGAWLLDVTDSSMRKILSDPAAEEFAWSPDGRRLAYHSRNTGEWNIWQMTAR